ncbi:DUF779 domain-containing protein [Mycobacterium sp. AMU20-3851]|jgi:uncharacterized protein (DUF779 family)|uniref:DUF779 domain-containing protein n=1 Tax=Mycobacterium sp. AMU20-3851 TaxID=3122055 RepID=UPI00375520F4
METAAARVSITRAAAALVVHLQNRHGALMFRQSEASGDDPAPVCCPVGEFSVGDSDVLLGMLDVVSARQPYGVPVWVSGPAFPVWEHSQMVIDVAPGRGAGFSLEASEGVRFLSLARIVPARHVEASHGDSARGQPSRG